MEGRGEVTDRGKCDFDAETGTETDEDTYVKRRGMPGNACIP